MVIHPQNANTAYNAVVGAFRPLGIARPAPSCTPRCVVASTKHFGAASNFLGNSFCPEAIFPRATTIPLSPLIRVGGARVSEARSQIAPNRHCHDELENDSAQQFGPTYNEEYPPEGRIDGKDKQNCTF